MTTKTLYKYAASALALAVFSEAAIAQDRTINNVQANWAQARAQLNSDIENINGEVSLTAAAINNSFSADVAGNAQIRNTQYTIRGAAAELNVDIDGVTGNVSTTAAAIGNSASIAAEKAAATPANQSAKVSCC